MLHLLFAFGHLTSTWIFPGLIMHTLITGIVELPKWFDPLEIIGSMAEIATNGTLYMLAILGVSRWSKG